MPYKQERNPETAAKRRMMQESNPKAAEYRAKRKSESEKVGTMGLLGELKKKKEKK